MNQYVQNAKSYVLARKEVFVGIAVALAVVVLAGLVALAIHNSTPKIAYQPVNACDLLTLSESKELMGDRVLNSIKQEPTLSGNTATSKCGYTDGNPDTENMIVAATIVRSGINDEGVKQNKNEFAASKASKKVETVENIGDGAYFNYQLGQLNILDGRNWIILSYGVGSTPEANTLNKALELANKIITPTTVVGTF